MFALLIKDVRESKGCSLSELAEKIGYSKTYVANLENGIRKISFEQAVMIAKALNVSTEELYEFK